MVIDEDAQDNLLEKDWTWCWSEKEGILRPNLFVFYFIGMKWPKNP